ncbi:hypothetical protein PPYR_06403 [Photinus pyralis]|uniref:Uncharacterized protein n=1 Tax=Photinus pyralis TaxID=7054 RepID=A0A1Y1N2T3_PHOPY|nr:uncharacterized protein LOC116166962 [Photinus pyralis]KAB0800664.1 hypothetical protein PPYR_06403 [Photinus pyralis]
MDCNKIEEDKDSVVSDRCWEEKHKGDSRKWLIRDGSRRNSSGQASVMRADYIFPESDERYFIGKRRAMIKQKLFEEVAYEIIDESKVPPPVEEYCTEYDTQFHYPQYDSNKKVERNTELFLKYPLYSSEAATFYKCQLNKCPRGEAAIDGYTSSKTPFRKCSEFTKEQSGDLSF